MPRLVAHVAFREPRARELLDSTAVITQRIQASLRSQTVIRHLMGRGMLLRLMYRSGEQRLTLSVTSRPRDLTKDWKR
jgi:hypothetical protein